MTNLELTPSEPIRRQTRSYVRRQGRITQAQKKAINELWSKFVIDPVQISEVIPPASQLILEIGFGMGESLLQMAIQEPQTYFLGIEVHRPGIGALIASAEKNQLTNLKIICGDALEVLQHNIPSQRLSRIQIFFPDPWPKKRHHKRRLINTENVALMYHCLKPGGELHVATDWLDYAQQIEQVLEAQPGMNAIPGNIRPAYRPVTKFERRGQRLGHTIRDVRFIKAV